jgi:transcriptional regulator with XRE-family HTH domain
MITNERQHRITKAEIKRFERAIARAEQEEAPAGVHPRLHEAMLDGLRSQVDELRAELKQYEALREGKIRRRVLTSLLDLPAALIEGRIVRRLTQKDLGQRLGIPEQQIQRYEKTRYAGVSLERLQEVADAVGITLRKTIEYDVRGPAGGDPPGSRRARHGRQGSRAKGALSDQAATSSRADSKGGEKVAGRRTGKAAASAAGKTLASKSTSKTAKRAAASDLAQVRNQKVTASKSAKRAVASDLSQTARKKMVT